MSDSTPETVRVLLIEDNPDDAAQIREMLVAMSLPGLTAPAFELEGVNRLTAGLERLDKSKVDVLLLDLSLPDSQGLATFTKIYAVAPNLPIVILTGFDDEAIAMKAVRTGAQDYLVKAQVNGDLLLRAIRYAIERQQLMTELAMARKREQEERERVQALRSHQHYLALSQLEEAESIVSLGEDRLRQLITRYHEVITGYVRAVRIQEDRPYQQVRQFAGQLASLRVGARDVVRIHLGALDKFTHHVLPSEVRAFSNDARLALVELMGNMMDIYLLAIGPGNHEEVP